MQSTNIKYNRILLIKLDKQKVSQKSAAPATISTIANKTKNDTANACSFSIGDKKPFTNHRIVKKRAL